MPKNISTNWHEKGIRGDSRPELQKLVDDVIKAFLFYLSKNYRAQANYLQNKSQEKSVIIFKDFFNAQKNNSFKEQ